MSEPITLVPSDRVAAALNYADYAANRGEGGYPGLWVSKFPAPSAGDRVLRFDPRTVGEGAPSTATRPELCMQILAAEVRRRIGTDAAVLRLLRAAEKVNDYHTCRLGGMVTDEVRRSIHLELIHAVEAVTPALGLSPKQEAAA